MAGSLTLDLQGKAELLRRLKAAKLSFKDAGRQWADATVPEAKRRIPVATGETRASIRRRNASQKKATVVGNYPVNFIDAGVRAHDITPRRATVLRWEDGGQTRFARRVHKRAIGARPFKKAAALAGLEDIDLLSRMVNAWNSAA